MERIKSLYKKHREILHYLIFGAAATALNLILYSVFVKGLGIERNISNILAWIITVAFAFVTNKVWVFESKKTDKRSLFKEGLSFFGSRLGTGVIEIGLLPILVALGMNESLFGVDAFLAKIVVTIVVVILNYVFSKFIVFGKNEHSEEKDAKVTNEEAEK